MAKFKPRGISMDDDIHKKVQLAAKKANMSMSQFICKLIENFTEHLVNDNNDKPIIITIPADLVDDEEKLRGWLHKKSEAIINALQAQKSQKAQKG